MTVAENRKFLEKDLDKGSDPDRRSRQRSEANVEAYWTFYDNCHLRKRLKKFGKTG